MMRRFLRYFLLVSLTLGAIAFGVVWFVLLDDEPHVITQDPPTSQDARMAREFVSRVRQAAKSPDQRIVTVSMAEANAVMRVGGHMLPGLRGVSGLRGDRLVVIGSVPVPRIPFEKWVNVRAAVPAFDGRLTADELELGGISFPPDLSIELGRIAANLVLGDGRGDKMLHSANRMDIEGDELAFHMALSEGSRGSVMTGMFDLLRGNRMPSAQKIDGYRELILNAMNTGFLPSSGSFTPYLIYTLEEARRRADPADHGNEYTAAIFGLTQICGAQGFTFVVGRLGLQAGESAARRHECRKLTLNNRIDSRRHFLIAAALQAASSRGFSVGIGEIKELHDSANLRNGFDFTDIAANNSGIRMSNLFMNRRLDDWPALIDRIQAESDIIIDFEGIPGLMKADEFERRFQDIESAQYKSMLEAIERRIDRLPLHRSDL